MIIGLITTQAEAEKAPPVEITGGIVLSTGYEGACAIGYGEFGDNPGSLKIPDNYTVYSIDTVKNGITFNGEKVGFNSKDGKIYFELTDVAAADLDTPYTLTIGETGYSYSVLDYVRECLSAPNAPYATKQLVSATYRYNRAADGYFDNQEE